LESTDNARHILDSSDSGTDELELQLQKCIIERNDLELTLEEAKQDTGLHITFSVFIFVACMFESLSFLQYFMFQGEKISKLSFV
jgi:hypothetical protein